MSSSNERKNNPLVSFAAQYSYNQFRNQLARDEYLIDILEGKARVGNKKAKEEYEQFLRIVSQRWVVPDEDQLVNEHIIAKYVRD